jgi:hypothetical protein
LDNPPLAFPEYSIPKQFHDNLQAFAEENNCGLPASPLSGDPDLVATHQRGRSRKMMPRLLSAPDPAALWRCRRRSLANRFANGPFAYGKFIE